MGRGSQQRRRHSVEDANRGAISEREIFDMAAIFLREHGEQAARQAGEWADLMLERGDRDGHEMWRRVLWAIEEARHLALRRAAAQDKDQADPPEAEQALQAAQKARPGLAAPDAVSAGQTARRK